MRSGYFVFGEYTATPSLVKIAVVNLDFTPNADKFEELAYEIGHRARVKCVVQSYSGGYTHGGSRTIIIFYTKTMYGPAPTERAVFDAIEAIEDEIAKHHQHEMVLALEATER